MRHRPPLRIALGLLLSFSMFTVPALRAQPPGVPDDPDAIDADRAIGALAGSWREVLEISDQEMARLARGHRDRQPRGPVFQAQAALSALSWSLLGPRPVLSEFWSGKADASGRMCSIAVDPTNASVVYAAAALGGVWKSTDGGTLWSPLTDGLSSLASGALAFDASNPGLLYYGTGEQNYAIDVFPGDGLFLTANGGATWSKVAPASSVGSFIARVAANGSRILVASDLGVARSADGGATWAVTLASGHCNDLAVDPATPSTVYAAIRSAGIYKSLDGGVTWTQLAGGLPTSGFKRINFGLSRSDPRVIYASFVDATRGNLLGMYRTADGGATWTQLTNTPDYLLVVRLGYGQGWYDNCVTVDPANANVCYAGGVFPYVGFGLDFGFIKTTNGGASWTDITVGKRTQLHPDQHGITLGPDGTVWVANDGGVWKSTNGGTTWIDCNHDLEVTQFYTVATHPTSATFLLGGTQDNGSLQYTGALGWPELNPGDGGASAVEALNPSTYYTTFVDLTLMYKWISNHGGKTVQGGWTSDRLGWGNNPVVSDPNLPGTILVGSHRLWRTTNSASSWAVYSRDLTVNQDLTGPGGSLRAISIARGNSNVIYTASDNGHVYVTMDGVNWNQRDAGLGTKKLPDIFVDPANVQHAYLCADTSGGDRVYTTSDAGLTWTSLTGDLPDGVRGMSLAVDFRTAPQRLYLGTDTGVYVSTNGGVNWVKSAGGLPNSAVYDLGLDVTNNRLVAATHGRGQWSSPIDTAPPLVALIAPAGHEVWRVGTVHDILWNARGTRGVESVSLLLSTDGGSTYPQLLASAVPNSGRYSWRVAEETSRACRVKVVACDPSGNLGATVSEADFALTDAAEPAAMDRPTEGFVLRPVAPNPGRPPIEVGFELAREARVALEVFDVLGRRIKVLDEGVRGAGSHTISWNGDDAAGRAVPNGLYLYRLRADGLERIRRVMLMR